MPSQMMKNSVCFHWNFCFDKTVVLVGLILLGSVTDSTHLAAQWLIESSPHCSFGLLAALYGWIGLGVLGSFPFASVTECFILR